MDTGIIEINNKKFYKVNITFALNKKDFFFDYFILLGNDKLIQYTNKNNYLSYKINQLNISI